MLVSFTFIIDFIMNLVNGLRHKHGIKIHNFLFPKLHSSKYIFCTTNTTKAPNNN